MGETGQTVFKSVLASAWRNSENMLMSSLWHLNWGFPNYEQECQQPHMMASFF